MLPRDFLIQLADKYDLSPEQKETFVESFVTDKTSWELAKLLNISPSAVSSRMTGIYQKFSISGTGPVKQTKLSTWVNQQYQTYKPSTFHPVTTSSKNDIDALVQQVRQKRYAKIQAQCGKMRMLYIEQPIDTTEIYTDVNILEQITSRQWREIPDLLKNFNPESDDFDRLGLSRREKRVPGLEAVKRYSKLMVLGKPGAGKTTFLKWLAVKCNYDDFQPHLIPIFITLKDFAKDNRTETEFNLFKYIKDEEFRYCGITDESITEVLLIQGRFLILLDGLDEVSEADEDGIIDEIRKFSKRYFQNHFIITCRIAVAKYRFQEENFTEVEVADFNSEQIEAFAKKWFVAVTNCNQEEGEVTAQHFLHNLKENQQMRELSVTPILLNLICLVFREKGKFTSKRSQLYEEGLNILLVRWDESRGIKRDVCYRRLSIEQKFELLSQIASITFDKNSYFFQQREVERYIAEYLRSLPNAQTDRANLQRDSEAVLKSIEAQHGLLVERAREIYSFSHLTFQEYFTARNFVTASDSSLLKQMANHLNDKSWQEVLILVTDLVSDLWRDYDYLFIKQQIDALVAIEDKLQKFLIWVKQKSISFKLPYKPAAVRDFYFLLAFSYEQELDFTYMFSWKLDCTFTRDFSKAVTFKDTPEFNLFDNLLLDLHLSRIYIFTLYFNRPFALNSEFNNILDISDELKQKLQKITSQLPKLTEDRSTFMQWWLAQGRNWADQLRSVMIKYRNIGHDWQFSAQEKKLLRQYYNANKLLVLCLNSSSNVSSEIRQEIEETLLLPISDIEKLQQRIL